MHYYRFAMMMIITTVLVFSASAALAAVSAEEAANLGRILTPMGAERAGNDAGTIPAWDGGLTKSVAGFKKGGHYPDPYAHDKPLFTIDASNMEKYKDNLTSGQMALLKKYPTYKMVVYPTRRSASFPEGHYKETMANATRVKLVEGGNGFAGTKGGIPFPIPKDGLEVIWNHLTRYRGDTYVMNWTVATVQRDGSYTLGRYEYTLDFHHGNLSKPEAERTPNKLFNFLEVQTAPAREAGDILLVHDFANQVKQPRQAWVYIPGMRRVRLAPNVAYDNLSGEGLATNDDFDMFNGAPDRYKWELVGKREVYIPYNSYKLVGNTVKYTDVIKPKHINNDLARYELHRVWVVEARLKPGTSHIYKRRTFYIDEDSWTACVIDKYDTRGELWRIAEQPSINFYNVPMIYPMSTVYYDLQSGRYFLRGLRNEEPKVYMPVIKPDYTIFTPAGLRSIGIR